jgi:hypothetical protein
MKRGMWWSTIRLMWLGLAVFGVSAVHSTRATGQCAACTDIRTCTGGLQDGFVGCAITMGGNCQNLGDSCHS